MLWMQMTYIVLHCRGGALHVRWWELDGAFPQGEEWSWGLNRCCGLMSDDGDDQMLTSGKSYEPAHCSWGEFITLVAWQGWLGANSSAWSNVVDGLKMYVVNCLPLHPCPQRCRISPVSIWSFRLKEEEVEREKRGREMEREGGGEFSLISYWTVHHQAGPRSHQLIMLHFPAQLWTGLGALQQCPHCCTHAYILTSTQGLQKGQRLRATLTGLWPVSHFVSQ